MLKHSLFVLVGLTIVGCSAAQNTQGQDAMWVAYHQCRSEGRVPANVQLIRVEPNGHGWYQTYSSSYGGADFERCIIATELVRLKVDLIVARGTPAILAAESATSTIPVITSASASPWRRASSPVSRAREGM